jgi:hypothetical protein
MKLVLVIAALAVVVLVWRSRGVEVWHVAVDQSAGRVEGP